MLNSLKFKKYFRIIPFLGMLFFLGCKPFGEGSNLSADFSSLSSSLPECLNDIFGSCVISSGTKATLEPNLIAANITNGVSIFGVTGTYQGPSPCTNDNSGSCRITQANKTLLEPNLLASNIMSGVTVFGVTGTLPVYSACVNDNNGNCAIPGASKTGIEPNLTAGNIQSGVSVFGVTGTYQGPSPCTNDNSGSCRITQANKTLLETNLVAANIKNGITIFGVLGSYTGSGTGSLDSNMHREKGTAQWSMVTESVTNAGSAYTNSSSGYRAVPDITKDDDGYKSANAIFVNRTGWGAKPAEHRKPL